jgi:hypothetical protein
LQRHILGHATLDMTMRAYAKATDRTMRDAINALLFATASAPSHVQTIAKPAEAAPIWQNGAAEVSAAVE